jgi:hypothetical protein
MWLIEVEDRTVGWHAISRDLGRVVARLHGDGLPAATLSDLRKARAGHGVPAGVSRGSVHAAYSSCSKTSL